MLIYTTKYYLLCHPSLGGYYDDTYVLDLFKELAPTFEEIYKAHQD